MDKPPLATPMPDPLRIKATRWVVVTPENAAAVFKRLTEKKQDPVLFALTDDEYQLLSTNLAELRNLIADQRKIIIKYKEYYEPPAK